MDAKKTPAVSSAVRLGPHLSATSTVPPCACHPQRRAAVLCAFRLQQAAVETLKTTKQQPTLLPHEQQTHTPRYGTGGRAHRQRAGAVLCYLPTPRHPPSGGGGAPYGQNLTICSFKNPFDSGQANLSTDKNTPPLTSLCCDARPPRGLQSLPTRRRIPPHPRRI